MSDQLVDIPEKKALPKAKKRSSVLRVPNFAGNEITVERVITKARFFLDQFKNQPARTKFLEDCREADAMFRMAPDQTKEDADKTQDEIDCVPGIFFHDVTLISSMESSILFHSPRPPVRFGPLNEASDTNRSHGEDVSEKQNRLLEWSMEMDDRVTKLKDVILFANKYRIQCVGMEWLRRVRRTQERRPSKNNPDKYTWQTVEEIEQRPVFKRYDMDDVWFDANTPDLRDQMCVLIRGMANYVDMVGAQEDGNYMNVENVTVAQLYNQEAPGEQRGDRQQNAGEGSDTDVATGQFEQWNCWMRLPIDDSGDWDPEGTLAEWHWVTFAGNMDGGELVCLRINPNPYLDDEYPLPVWLVRTHRDDKNAYSMGLFDLERGNFKEIKTTRNQYADNKNKVNNSPWLIEQGAFISKDLTFHPNHLLVTAPGGIGKIQRLIVPPNTNDSRAYLEYLDAVRRYETFTDKPVTGEAFGARTSASEVRMAYNVAEKPGEEKLRYLSDQLLLPMAKKDRALWKQYAPRDLVITIAGEGYADEIKPATLWGPMKVKVTAIDEWQDDTIRRLEQDKFAQITVPVMPSIIGAAKTAKLMGYLYKNRRVLTEDEWQEVFGAIGGGDLNAKETAQQENIGFVSGIYDEPQQGENHAAHLIEHEGVKPLYAMIPDLAPDVIPMLDAHIAATKALQAQEGAPMQPGMTETQGAEREAQAGMPQGMPPEMAMGAPTGLPTAEAPVETEGAAMQNILGAEGGGMMA